MALSVLRRYTPPTCTLEILGTQSPLSRWMGQPMVKQLRFRLSLDDPKLPQEEWVTIQGDRTQLETLCEIVTAYVQQFLKQPSQAKELVALEQNGSIVTLTKHAAPEIGVPPALSNHLGITLTPRGLLSHELSLGSLASNETGPTTRLSALQLFDLAEALDDYASEIIALPGLQPSKPGWKPTPTWAQIAAICLVVVGLSTTVIKLMQHSPSAIQTTASTNNQSPSSSDQQIATQLPPVATSPSTPPNASNQKLPPPPPLGSTTPLPSVMPKVVVPPVISANPPTSTSRIGNVAPSQKNSDQVATLPPSIAANEARGSAPSTFAAPTRPDSAMPSAAIAKRSANSTAETDQLRSGAPSAQPSTAFDTIPQVAEVRRYFQQRWSPPQGLTQTLEYTLTIAPNGTIRQITPLGQAAGDYVDRTGIPLVGEPFVSPLSSGRNARIRLVLSPDGKVQTFLEQMF